VSSEAVRVVGAEELRRLLPMAGAIDALEQGFATLDPSEGAPPRSHLDTEAGALLVMAATGERGVGVKLVTVTPSNPALDLPFVHAVYVLFDPRTQAPVAVVDGESLTALRTAAVSALATRWLARQDAHRLVVFGAGVQARSHVEAMRVVRPVDELIVISRTSARAETLAEDARSGGLDAKVGSANDVAAADIVCTCTTSDTPLFDGASLRAGAHVNAVGAYRPDAREVDTATIARARVVVETRGAALAEAGDLLIPMGEGAIRAEHVVADLAELVRGKPVRRSIEDITLFESVGIAFEDLTVAVATIGMG
jgi:ornithine cyclodeaminase/alanine dehydrogenase-like protein (mu-crystallin family)